MSFSQENGYTPATIEEIIDELRQGINAEFATSYTSDSFLGTNYYKFFYALAQRVQEGEVTTSEIFAKLQQYFVITNESIERPVVTNFGLLDVFSAAGFVVSIKPPEDADAGKLFVCVDTDDGDPDYSTTKLQINTIIKDSSAAGVVSQGTEVNSIAISNGQSFDFKFNLPNSQSPKLRLTTVLSENNESVILSVDDIKALLMANIAARYRLGKNFEPERYFSIVDAPWAETVLLEYSLDGGANYLDDVFEADYDDKFEILLANISVVES